MTIAIASLVWVLGGLGTVSAQSEVDYTASKSKITLKALAAQVATLTQSVNTLQGNVTTLQGQLTTANSTIASLQTLLNSTSAQNVIALGQFVTVDKTDTLNGLKAPHIIFSGVVDVRIVANH